MKRENAGGKSGWIKDSKFVVILKNLLSIKDVSVDITDEQINKLIRSSGARKIENRPIVIRNSGEYISDEGSAVPYEIDVIYKKSDDFRYTLSATIEGRPLVYFHKKQYFLPAEVGELQDFHSVAGVLHVKIGDGVLVLIQDTEQEIEVAELYSVDTGQMIKGVFTRNGRIHPTHMQEDEAVDFLLRSQKLNTKYRIMLDIRPSKKS